MKLASRFGRVNQIRRDRPLTREELMGYVPSVFSEDKHESRSERYTYIPTITLLESLKREGFEPFFACQTRVRDQSRREHTKHMLRLRRAGQLTGHQVPEIILLNSHDGSSSYQMLPGLFRGVCTNGLVCGQSFGEVKVPHKGDVVEKVIEGAYEVLGIFDRVEEKRDAMQSLILPLADLERMLFLLDGKTIPDNRHDVTIRLMNFIRDNPRQQVFGDDLFTIRLFQKGSGHITFKRMDLVEKMNEIIANHYPGMLAAR